MAGPIAWIAEDWDEDDALMASGRFSAHVEDGHDLGDGIEGASLEAALAWARERCDLVLIRLYDSDYFSAGTLNPDPAKYPEWTGPPWPAERRRPRGLEVLDRTEDDPPVPWDVRFSAKFASRRRVLAAVLEDERVAPVPDEARDAQAAGAQVSIHASTEQQARAIAEDVLRTRVEPLLRRRPRRTGLTSASYEVYPLAPEGPVRFGAAR